MDHFANFIRVQIFFYQKVDNDWQPLVDKVVTIFFHADKGVAKIAEYLFDSFFGRVVGQRLVDKHNNVSADGAGDDIFGRRL